VKISKYARASISFFTIIPAGNADVNEKFFCPHCHDDDSVRAGEAAA
jgi:hypothetical protein